MISALFFAVAAMAVDGDTLRVGRERIRLSGIDAPEIHGCPRYRTCVRGDGLASRRSLQGMMSGSMSVRRLGVDRYGRTLALVYSNGVNVACEQIRRGKAVYVRRWDTGGRLAAECR